MPVVKVMVNEETGSALKRIQAAIQEKLGDSSDRFFETRKENLARECGAQSGTRTVDAAVMFLFQMVGSKPEVIQVPGFKNARMAKIALENALSAWRDAQAGGNPVLRKIAEGLGIDTAPICAELRRSGAEAGLQLSTHGMKIGG